MNYLGLSICRTLLSREVDPKREVTSTYLKLEVLLSNIHKYVEPSTAAAAISQYARCMPHLITETLLSAIEMPERIEGMGYPR